MIVLYGLIVIVGQQIHEKHDHSVFGAVDAVELAFIVFMVIEHLVTVAMMHDHFINYWSLWDLIMLVEIVALYIADVIVDHFSASAVFKI